MDKRIKKFIITAIFVCCLIGSSSAFDLRFEGGLETIPISYNDLDSYNTGIGLSLSSELVWGGFSSTVIEMGYRHWELKKYTDYKLELHRFGLLQRFYPLYKQKINYKPYIGFGVTFNNEEAFSIVLKDSDYGGLTVFSGCAFPLYKESYFINPIIRWELDFETDYVYTYISFGLNFSVNIK